ncbi:hypothetical protein EQW78_06745 [Oerskovia turbata]|uniref:DUF7455 domain-containing protein n=1 Tax=Oerskovia turbata TaxID=1713 RepID=A0A4V1N5D5_9CELL|nr:hypothetical protein [Oerskovia turbata]RXR25140.1 hypothetical protein EQW73_12775 [Oerskovia turbata]RXR35286.1 hypothetical protein EQW78_06745 [Oerskovia turbata]TGJ95236.1 hypothetical protein DLJ96_16675 [Actinotalea fermentans ATCC 43279 = JCM 9966 = DSM 3133]
MNHLRRPWEPPDADPHDVIDRCDRCDACGATACVRVTVAGLGPLFFCDAHYARHESAITAAGHAVSDGRRSLDDDIALALALARALDSAA